jgi:hypothetical protein
MIGLGFVGTGAFVVFGTVEASFSAKDVFGAVVMSSSMLAKASLAHAGDGRVGIELLSETDRVRVWAIGLKPRQRLGFHTHVLDYFWTAVTGGRGR